VASACSLSPSLGSTGHVTARVAWISVAPVKGLSLVGLSSVELSPLGAQVNRAFYLVDENGEMVNGKRLGSLVSVMANYDPARETLSLAFPDGSGVDGHVNTSDQVTTSFFGRPVLGHLVKGPWSGALSEYFGRSLTLVKTVRAGEGVDRGPTASVTILSEASVERLAEALGAGTKLDPRRFRMLFGVSGVAAHAEDAWLGHRVRLGEAVVAVRGLVGRCLVTSQDPDTGTADLGTLRALGSYRPRASSAEKLPFGVWAEVVEPGRVALADVVERQ
jgi:uncharacterized protein YcbX